MMVSWRSGIAALALAFALLAGCPAPTSTTPRFTAYTEAEFAASTSLAAAPGDTLVVLLEGPGEDSGRFADTASAGVDELRLAVAEPTTFSLTLAANSGVALLEVLDASDNLQLFASAGSGGSTTLTPGSYTLRLSAAGTGLLPLFFGTLSASSSSASYSVRVAGCPGCELGGVDLRFYPLDGADFQDANLADTDLSFAALNDARLDDIEAPRLDAVEVNAIDASFRFATLRDAEFTRGKLRNADFTGADLTRADFRFADLRFAKFRNATLRDADFTGATLGSADFSGADTTGAEGLD